MHKLLASIAAMGLALIAASASAENLKLPDNLAGFSTSAGETYFAESDAREAYFPLASNFLTQKTQAYCGVASIVMVLNALNIPAPAVPEYEPYRTLTQDNVLTAATEAVLPADVLAHKGMTLDQIGGILATQPVKAEVHHAADSSPDEFASWRAAGLGSPAISSSSTICARRSTRSAAVISRRWPPMIRRPTVSSSSTSTRRGGMSWYRPRRFSESWGPLAKR
jgi:Phytochelatin synthase